MATRTARTADPLDEAAFLSLVGERLKTGGAVGEIVASVLDAMALAPAFEEELVRVGAVNVALKALNQAPRRHALRTVKVRSQRDATSGYRSVVVRSELRDWPLSTASGRRVELATPAEVDAELTHIGNVMAGLASHARVLRKLRDEAIAAGVATCGELSDDVLEACLWEGVRDASSEG
jgi:hypothetical protein